VPIGPYPSWSAASKIVSIDPFGAIVADAFKSYFEKDYDIRPTIAVTKAPINMMELSDAIRKGRLKVDGNSFLRTMTS